MTLNYYLPEGMTNDDLTDEEHDMLYSTCVHMMVTGTSDLKTFEAINEFQVRLNMYLMTNGLDQWDDKKWAFVLKMKGLTTNVSPESDHQFHKDVIRWARTHAEALARSVTPNE